MYPPHQAFRLLKKWNSEKTSIRLLITLSFGVGSFIGRVAEVEGASIRFLSADSSADFLLSLLAAAFEYRTQKVEPESTPPGYTRSLIAAFPSGAKVVFSEVP